MKQFRGTTFTFGSRRLKLDAYWAAAALALAAVNGYFFPNLVLNNSTSLVRFGGALAFPLAVSLSLLLFETAHVLAGRDDSDARKTGRRLYPTGSVETGYVLPDSPGQEFQREATPTLTLVALAALVLSISEFLIASQDFQIMLQVVAILIGGVAALNILPAMPFAGGRVLRSLFWYLNDDHVAGSRVAFFYGLLIALIGIGFGGIFLIWTPASILPGIWCLFLSWLVLSASRDELMRSRLIQRAESVIACDAVAGLNPTLRASAPLTDAIDILLEQRENGPALVRDRTVYSGTLSLNSIRRIPRSSWTELTVQDAAVSLDLLADSPPGASLLYVLRVIDETDEGLAIVRDEQGRICGLVDATMDAGMLLRRGISRDVRLSRPVP